MYTGNTKATEIEIWLQNPINRAGVVPDSFVMTVDTLAKMWGDLQVLFSIGAPYKLIKEKISQIKARGKFLSDSVRSAPANFNQGQPKIQIQALYDMLLRSFSGIFAKPPQNPFLADEKPAGATWTYSQYMATIFRPGVTPPSVDINSVQLDFDDTTKTLLGIMEQTEKDQNAVTAEGTKAAVQRAAQLKSITDKNKFVLSAALLVNGKPNPIYLYGGGAVCIVFALKIVRNLRS